MNELTVQEPVVEYQRTALIFKQKPTWEQAESLVNTLLTMEQAVQFWIGDCLVNLSGWFPTNYEQLFPDGYAAKSLANMKWVSTRIPGSRRREELSWSHHATIAGLDNEDDQNEALETAVLNDMTVSETREFVRSIKGAEKPGKQPKVIHVICAHCGHEFQVEVD